MIYYRKTLFGRGPKLTAVHLGSSCVLVGWHYIYTCHAQTPSIDEYGPKSLKDYRLPKLLPTLI